MVQTTNPIVFQPDRQEQCIRRENILIYGNYGVTVEEDKEVDDGGEKILPSGGYELKIDLQPSSMQRVHLMGQKRRNKENPRPIIVKFVSYKKRNEFLANKQILKNSEDRHHVLVYKDLTPLRYKFLKYMQKFCSDTFISCYTRS